MYDNDSKRKQSLDTVLRKLQSYAESTNIADELDEEQLSKIGVTARQEYDLDVESRAEWKESADKAMEVASQVRQAKSFPFHMASNVKYPLVTVAALQFGARAYPAIVDGKNIVKGVPIGDDNGQPMMGPDGQPVVNPETGEPQFEVPPGAKREKAERIGEHMSYQLTYEMEEWEEDTDVLLHHLPIIGCCFRKVWRDEAEKRNRSEMVPAIHLVVNNKTRSLRDCPRITHEFTRYPYEIQENQLNGVYLDIELPTPASANNDTDAPHELLEQHRMIDLDEDGYREPYIVTVHKDTGKVLRIVANYDFDEINHDGKRITRIPKDQYFVKYSFLPDPKGGFYDVGFGRLLESLSSTIDSVINQMIDAGTLQNAGGGFIGSGIQFKKGKVEFSPGKYTQVDATGANLKDAIYNFEHPGPSAVSFSILELMLSAATDITGVKDIFTGDSGNKGVQTATTTLALIEQGMKVFTAIYKRIYRALKQEFKLLFYLNSKHLSDQEYFTVMDNQQSVAKKDYDWNTIDVMPVADPRMVTDMQRLARAQAVLPLIELGIVNPIEAGRRYLIRIGEENVEELLAQPAQPSPVDQLQMAEIASKVKNTDANTDKTKVETELLKPEFQLEANKEHREDFKAITDAEQADENLAQQSFGQDATIAQKEQELDQRAEETKQKAKQAA